jgi:hypothetical protein
MGTVAIQSRAYLERESLNDSIFWGAQLIELDSANLRATSKRGEKTHTFIGRRPATLLPGVEGKSMSHGRCFF